VLFKLIPTIFWKCLDDDDDLLGVLARYFLCGDGHIIVIKTLVSST